MNSVLSSGQVLLMVEFDSPILNELPDQHLNNVSLLPANSRIAFSQPKFANSDSFPTRNLPGFKKTFRLPTVANASTQAFLGQVVDEDLKSEFQKIHRFVREHFGLKRKDIEVTIEGDGSAILECRWLRFQKHFSFDNDPELVHCNTSLDAITDLNILAQPGFDQGFPYRFARLELAVTEPLDIEKLIDRLEEQNESDPGLNIDYDFAATQCEVRMPDLPTVFLFRQNELILSAPIPYSGPKLVQDFASYQELLQNALTT